MRSFISWQIYTSKATTRATNNDPRLRSTSIISTFSSVPPSGSSVLYDSPEPSIREQSELLNEDDEDDDEKSKFQLMIEKEQEIR